MSDHQAISKEISWRVVQDFITDQQCSLIEVCLKRTGLEAAEVRVRELGRVGKSGARLLVCDITHGPLLVIKVHARERINREFRLAREQRNAFPEVLLYRKALAPTGSRNPDEGALLYYHVGAHDIESVGLPPQTPGQVHSSSDDEEISRELRDVVYARRDNRNFRYSDAQIEHFFRSVWYCLRTARKGASSAIFSFREEYKEYIEKRKPSNALKAMLGTDSKMETVEFLNRSMCNPLWFVEDSCFTKPYRGQKGPVHGDLHGNNVIIDADDKLHLIDFAWAGVKHVLVDYVLMENSLRFLLFPHNVNPDVQLAVDMLLLKADGMEDVLQREFGDLTDYYHRLAVMLRSIRNHAWNFLSGPKTESKDVRFLEYLAAQFLVLFGQVAYPDFNQLMAARALGIIAGHLRTNDFGNSPGFRSSAVAE